MTNKSEKIVYFAILGISGTIGLFTGFYFGTKSTNKKYYKIYYKNIDNKLIPSSSMVNNETLEDTNNGKCVYYDTPENLLSILQNFPDNSIIKVENILNI